MLSLCGGYTSNMRALYRPVQGALEVQVAIGFRAGDKIRSGPQVGQVVT